MAVTFSLTPVVSQVRVGEQNYYLKDQESRTNINNIQNDIDTLYLAVGDMSSVQGVMKLVGKLSSTFELKDGDTTPDVILDGTIETYNPAHGDVVIDGSNHAEFVWIKTTPSSTTNVGRWELIGDESLWVQKGDSLTFVPVTTSATAPLPDLTHSHGVSITTNSSGNYQPAGTLATVSSGGDALALSVTSGNVVTSVTSSIQLPQVYTTFTPNFDTVTYSGSVSVNGNVSLSGSNLSFTADTAVAECYFTVTSGEILSLNVASTPFIKTASTNSIVVPTSGSFSTTTAVSLNSTEQFMKGITSIVSGYLNDLSDRSISITSTVAPVTSSGTLRVKFTGTTVNITTQNATPSGNITYTKPGALQTITF